MKNLCRRLKQRTDESKAVEREALTWRQKIAYTRVLMVDTLRNRARYRHEMKAVNQVMYTKAWFFHSLMNLTRVVYPILGIAYWQTDCKEMAKDERLNLEFCERS